MLLFSKNIALLSVYSKNFLFKNAVTKNFGRKLIQECACPLTVHTRTFSSQSASKSEPLVEGCSNSSSESSETEHADPFTKLSSLTNGDEELEHKLKVIILETEVFRQEGQMVPPDECIKLEDWKVLLNSSSRSMRQRYLTFLFKKWKKKENDLTKKIEKRKEFEEFMSTREVLKHLSIEEHALNYGLLGNNIFIRFHESTINHFYNFKLMQAIQFGEKIVIDCGYEENMTKRENVNTAKQIMLLFADNRVQKDPFDIHYTNVKKGSEFEQTLVKYFPTLYEKDFPMNLHENSYLDIFPKDKLVYLTPHCREEMEEYDPDAVYIIGGIVDKTNKDPLSLAKAKREGLTMRKFPLDRHLQWGSGSGKSLTINQCVSILSDLKATGDWKHSLRHVPTRKLADTQIIYNKDRSPYQNRWDKVNKWKPTEKRKTNFKTGIARLFKD